MDAVQVADEIREIPGAEAVLVALSQLDVFTFAEGELPYPVPMAGDEFFSEVIAAIRKKLSI